MRIGTWVTVLSPLPMKDHKDKTIYSAKRGKYKGRNSLGERMVELANGSQIHLIPGAGGRITTKPVDIGPCGLKE